MVYMFDPIFKPCIRLKGLQQVRYQRYLKFCIVTKALKRQKEHYSHTVPKGTCSKVMSMPYIEWQEMNRGFCITLPCSSALSSEVEFLFSDRQSNESFAQKLETIIACIKVAVCTVHIG